MGPPTPAPRKQSLLASPFSSTVRWLLRAACPDLLPTHEFPPPRHPPALHVRGARASRCRDREPFVRPALGPARAGLDQPRRAQLRAVVSPRLGLAQALGVGARQPAGALDTGQARAPDAVCGTAALGRAPGAGAHDAARRGAAPGTAAGVRARRRRQPGGARARRQPRPRLADAADPRRSEPGLAPGRALRRQRRGAAQPARRAMPRRRLPCAATGAGRAGVQSRLAAACSSPARTS